MSLKKGNTMKFSRILSITLFTSFIALSLQSKNDDSDFFVANETGKRFDALPAEVRHSGKKVTLTLPDCKETMIVQIKNMWPKGAGKDQFYVTQVIKFTPERKSQQVHFLAMDRSNNNSVQTVDVSIMPEATWHLKIEEAKADTTKQPGPNLRWKELNEQLKKSPQNIFEFKYDDIKNNQVIKLPCPSAGTANINQVADRWKDLFSGAAFDKLPESVKKSGKTLKLSLQTSSSIDILVRISQSVVTPSGIEVVVQKVIIAASTESVTVDIPQVPKGSVNNNENLSFNICPLKLSEYLEQPASTRKHYNFNDELDRPGQPANGETRLMQALATTVSYSYDKLPKHIVLPNPTEILHDLLGCCC